LFNDHECGLIKDGNYREIGLANFRQMVEVLMLLEHTDRQMRALEHAQ
jgi:hypothetical protein